MEIAYATEELRNLCEISEDGEKVLGTDVARVLRNRLSDLYAIDKITDLPIGLQIKDPNKFGGSLMIELKTDAKIVIIPNHVNNPTNSSGRIDWNRVFRVKIIAIGDTYDS